MVQDETGCKIVQSQVNLVQPLRATDRRQVQNKIIICRIDSSKGLKWGLNTVFVMQHQHTRKHTQASGYNFTWKQTF